MRILRCIDKIVIINTTILQVDFGRFYTRLAYITSVRNYTITS